MAELCGLPVAPDRCSPLEAGSAAHSPERDTQGPLHGVALGTQGREVGLCRGCPLVRLPKSAGEEDGPSLRILLSFPQPVSIGSGSL